MLATSLLPIVLRGGVSPASAMIALFGLLAIAVGTPLSLATGPRLTEGAARNVCVVLESLALGAAGGSFGFFVQRFSLFSVLDPLDATLAIVFVALFGFAALARVATARQGSAAFLSSSESLFSLGGSLDPVSFLVLQPSWLVFAAVVGRVLAAQAGDSREASSLALALAFAVVPVFVRVELALCVKRWRDTTAAWPSYGALAWAALLGLVAFPEILRWSVALPGVLLGASPRLAWPRISLARAFCYLVALAACVSCYVASRRPRRARWLRVAGYLALGLGSLLPVSVGLACDDVHQLSPIPIATVLAVAIVLPAALIIGAHHWVFTPGEKPAAAFPAEPCLGVASPAQAETL